MKKSFLIILALTPLAYSDDVKPFETKAPEPKRIESFSADKSKSLRVYISNGLGSVLRFPCEIKDAFLGNIADYELNFSPNTKSIIHLQSKHASSRGTNLIARCDGQQNFFVIDITPSRTKHQDVVVIRNLSGFVPRREDIEERPKRKPIVLAEPVLIDSSDGSHLKGKEREEFLKQLEKER